jgi:HEAT repeat protein
MTWPDAGLVARGSLYTALVLVGAYIVFLSVLLGIAMRRTRRLRARRGASSQLAPALQTALVDFLAGGTDESLFRQHIRTQPEDVAAAILRFQTTVSGSARDRLCSLALDLGLVHQWTEEGRSQDVLLRRAAFANLAFACMYEPCRRVAGDMLLDGLEDPDEEVRLSACRGLVQAGQEQVIEKIFALAIKPNLLTRVVLTEDLRRYALSLATGPVRQALRSDEAGRIRATFEILVGWERAMPLEELREFLEHRDREIRVYAFRLAAFVTLNQDSRRALMRSLNDPDAGIRGLAIVAVGLQKMTEAIPELALCLRREGLEEARHAAAALAAMPPEGWRTLKELRASPVPATAQAAGEALACLGMEA